MRGVGVSGRLHYILAIVISLIFCFLSYSKPHFMEGLNLKLYDFLFLVRGSERPPEDIVIAAIDELSIEKLGRWPWSRDKFAKLVRRLSEYGASVIAFDVIFSEPEINDRLLARSLDEAGCVVLPIVFFFDKEDLSEKKGIHESSLYISNEKKLSLYFPVSSKSVLTPCEPLLIAASGFGHINMFPDLDGVIRQETLYIEYRGRLFPSLSLKTAAYYLGVPKEKLIVDATRGIHLGKRYVSTDVFGRILIPYYGGNQTFKHISIVDVLEGKTKKEEIEGKIVLIGATAVGIYDLRVTPLSSALPGVEKHANVIASLIAGKNLVPAPGYMGFILIVFSALFVTFLYQRLRAFYALFVLLTVLLSVFFLSYGLFVKGVWLPYFYASSSLVTQFIVTTALRYAISEREARRIRKIFSSYVTEKVVNELIRNPSMAKLGGERREVTVLFSDIRGFTSLSEKQEPENVVSILNEYFGKMTEIIFKWEGTLDKFMGDAIMVFWGAPLSQPDHAERAVGCSLEMSEGLKELCKKWELEGKPPLRMGIGINTGEVLVGNVGALNKKMEYTVIGDNVNLASRLEGLNKKFDSEIILSEFTLQKVRNKVENGVFGPILIRGIGNVAVKGKEKPVRIYTIEKLKEGGSKIIEVSDQEVITIFEK